MQTLTDLPKVRFIVSAQKQGLLYAASISQIWCIQAVDVARQREVLVNAKQFQLALKLTVSYIFIGIFPPSKKSTRKVLVFIGNFKIKKYMKYYHSIFL